MAQLKADHKPALKRVLAQSTSPFSQLTISKCGWHKWHVAISFSLRMPFFSWVFLYCFKWESKDIGFFFKRLKRWLLKDILLCLITVQTEKPFHFVSFNVLTVKLCLNCSFESHINGSWEHCNHKRKLAKTSQCMWYDICEIATQKHYFSSCLLHDFRSICSSHTVLGRSFRVF